MAQTTKQTFHLIRYSVNVARKPKLFIVSMSCSDMKFSAEISFNLKDIIGIYQNMLANNSSALFAFLPKYSTSLYLESCILAMICCIRINESRSFIFVENHYTYLRSVAEKIKQMEIERER